MSTSSTDDDLYQKPFLILLCVALLIASIHWGGMLPVGPVYQAKAKFYVGAQPS